MRRRPKPVVISSWIVVVSDVIIVAQLRLRNVVHAVVHFTIAGTCMSSEFILKIIIDTVILSSLCNIIYLHNKIYAAKSVKYNIGNNINLHAP